MDLPHHPPANLPPFCHLNSITLHSIAPVHLGGHPIDAGIALTCTGPTTPTSPPLLTLPSTSPLILTTSSLEIASKSDPHLLAAFNAATPLSLSHRGKTLIYLLLRHATAAGLNIGTHDAWSEYLKFLPPFIPLPTAWNESSRCLLTGTSLASAVTHKHTTLTTEFTAFTSALTPLPWAAPFLAALTLQHWIHADALYRSRVLSFPAPLGPAMVPVLDFANHRSGMAANAYYAVEEDAVVLRARAGIEAGEEVTIDYAAGEKSAAEMVFSYGFLEDTRESAGGMVLSVSPDLEDPVGALKARMWGRAPVLRLREEAETVGWECGFIYLTVTNPEDGLDFRALQTQDGGRELQMWFRDAHIEPDALEGELRKLELWPLMRLRAVVLLQQRVEEVLAELEGSEEACGMLKDMELVGEQEWAVAMGLRRLEGELMRRVHGEMEREKGELLADPVVVRELERMQREEEAGGEEELVGEDLS